MVVANLSSLTYWKNGFQLNYQMSTSSMAEMIRCLNSCPVCQTVIYCIYQTYIEGRFKTNDYRMIEIQVRYTYHAVWIQNIPRVE
jgi:hypothetical protein